MVVTILENRPNGDIIRKYTTAEIGSISEETDGAIVYNTTLHKFVQYDGVDWVDLKEGQLNTASGSNSHAEGYSTTASGDRSHSEGHTTTSSGHYSHAEGVGNVASNTGSHAEGYSTNAAGTYSHAEGWDTDADGTASHAEGKGTTATGAESHAEGLNSTALGADSHAEGHNTDADGAYGAHAEGRETTATGEGSHAEGRSTEAERPYSHAEGFVSKATMVCGHASSSGGHGWTKGAAQYQRVVLTTSTTNGTVVMIMRAGANSSAANGYGIVLAENRAVAFEATVVAVGVNAANKAFFTCSGQASRRQGQHILLHHASVVQDYATSTFTPCVVTIGAYTTAEELQIRVRGITGQAIRWVATVHMTEILGA